jgi:hypothetical protein
VARFLAEDGLESPLSGGIISGCQRLSSPIEKVLRRLRGANKYDAEEKGRERLRKSRKTDRDAGNRSAEEHVEMGQPLPAGHGSVTVWSRNALHHS